MNKNQQLKLKNELILEGASKAEVGKLVGLASSLTLLKKPVAKLPRKLSIWPRTLIFTSSSFVVAVVLTQFVVVGSQTGLPGSRLYSVQKVSDSLAVSISPSYRGTVMMRRAQQVKQLVADNANPNLVTATLAEYQSEASAYKSQGYNYEVFEYCKTNLEQAASIASGPELQALNNTLNSLKDV